MKESLQLQLLPYLGNLGASLYYVGRLPKCRNQGLGSTVTHAYLKAAKDKNIAQSVLYRSKMGQSMYKKDWLQTNANSAKVLIINL